MARDQAPIEGDPGVEHVLIEGCEAFALRLHAVAEQGKFLELQVLLLLEKKGEPEPDPEGERQAERLNAKVVGFDRAGRPRGRHDKIAKPRGIGQQHDLAGLLSAHSQLRDVAIQRAAAGSQSGRALNAQSKPVHHGQRRRVLSKRDAFCRNGGRQSSAALAPPGAERIEAIGQAFQAKSFGFIWFYLVLFGFAWFWLDLLGLIRPNRGFSMGCEQKNKSPFSACLAPRPAATGGFDGASPKSYSTVF